MSHQPEETGFWEKAFNDKKEMWGMQPAMSAVITKDFFVQQGVKSVLIPGVGYGRNAQPFIEAGMAVTGIEISQTALDMAIQHYGEGMTIHHGSVLDMPFSHTHYNGIFCYSLIHLLDTDERIKLIADCYDQLNAGGYMVFVAISKKAHTYGQGELISKDRYEIHKGVQIYFYDEDSIHDEFDKYGLFEILEIEESFPFYLIKCRKNG